MSVIKTITIKDDEGTDLEIRLCGRKGNRYLECLKNSRNNIKDDVNLDNVEWFAYDTDWMRKPNDVSVGIMIGAHNSYWMVPDKSECKNGCSQYDNIDNLRKLGLLFDEIKESLQCEKLSDSEAKDIILKNHRLIKILSSHSIISLAEEIDSLKGKINEKSNENSNKLEIMKKEIENLKSSLAIEKILE